MLAVILAITLYYVFNGIGSRTLARDELIGTWANEETGATVEFTSDERAQVRNFTRIPSLTAEPVPGQDLNGRWYLYEGDVAVSLDERREPDATHRTGASDSSSSALGSNFQSQRFARCRIRSINC